MLERITVSEDNPGYYSQSGVLYSNNQIEYVPLKVSGHVVIPEGVTRIDSYEFEGHSELTAITIPNSVTFIGWYAFNGCSGLTSITLPDSVASIGERAFVNCSGLASITIGDGVTSVGERAFMNCGSLTSVVFENPNGWSAGGAAIPAADLADPAAAAEYLTDTYCWDVWTRT